MIYIFIFVFLFNVFLSVLFHFLYNKFPNKVSAVLFPVNESIWEHMKLIASPMVLTIFLEIILFSAFNIYASNLFFANAISFIIGIIVYLAIYLPFMKYMSHNAFVAISLLVLVFLFINYISFKIMFSSLSNFNILGVILIIISYVIFYIFTYNPPKMNLFYDTQEKKYGI